MNERIQELYEQSWIEGSYQEPIPIEFAGDEQRYKTIKTSNFDHKKFAELIVKECAEQIVAKGTDWVDFAPSQTGVRPEYWAMAQHIKEHFGVEE